MCTINLNNKIPINLRPYWVSISDQNLINNQIEELLKYNLIRKSISPYSFPITLADKNSYGLKGRDIMNLRGKNFEKNWPEVGFLRPSFIIKVYGNIWVFSGYF